MMTKERNMPDLPNGPYGASATIVTVLIFCGLVLVPTGLGAEPKKGANPSWGLLFDLGNILSAEAYSDGYQAGAGAKYRLKDGFALRGLVGIDCNVLNSVASTTLGLGAAGEWHLASGAVSPYAGPLAGMRFLFRTGSDNLVDIYFGAMFGVEVEVIRQLSIFAEYDLVASLDASGFSLGLGGSGSGTGGARMGFSVNF
jgi:hypothetical protein